MFWGWHKKDFLNSLSFKFKANFSRSFSSANDHLYTCCFSKPSFLEYCKDSVISMFLTIGPKKWNWSFKFLVVWDIRTLNLLFMRMNLMSNWIPSVKTFIIYFSLLSISGQTPLMYEGRFIICGGWFSKLEESTFLENTKSRSLESLCLELKFFRFP